MNTSKKVKNKLNRLSAFDVINYILLTSMAIMFVVPFWSTIVSSFISEQERLSRGLFIFWPRVFDFGAYEMMLKPGSGIYSAYGVTVLRTVLGTASSMLVTIPAAYTLSRKNVPFRNLLTFIAYFTMLFNGGLIPTYLVIKATGITDTLWVYILPNLVNVWNMLILRNFFMQIPESIVESATIDGASVFKTLVRIVVPLSMSSIVTISMFYGVWHWNAWFDASLYVMKETLKPMQLVLRDMLMASTSETFTDTVNEAAMPEDTIKSATIVISTLPMLIVYPFVQKYFVKGVMVGSVKG